MINSNFALRTSHFVRLKMMLYLFSLFLSFISIDMKAQIASDLSLNWNVQVGCQVYPDGRKGAVYFEDIVMGECLGVCENTNVTYSFSGTLPENLETIWTAIGGMILSQTSSSMVVNWGISGSGQIGFSLNANNTTVSKTLCVDIKQKPIASFTVQGNEIDDTITVCKGQPISFNNISSANGGTDIVSSYWIFDNGSNSVSSANSPIYTFNEVGEFRVHLKVTNACNCEGNYGKIIRVIEGETFPISCASIVCDKQLATYSLDLEQATAECNNNYEWQIQGGHIINYPNSPIIEVLWDDVDTSGFGYVTFNSQNCNGACNTPTTIKIPVIQNVGTIAGNPNLCVGEQARYTLPQWASTNFNWTIVGGNGTMATVVDGDQRNEVILTANQVGTIILKAVYENTLLHCGGAATFEINVKNPATIIGESQLCLNTAASYHLASNTPANWTLSNSQGSVLNEVSNIFNFTYDFTAANITPGTYKLIVSGDDICNNQVKFITVIEPPAPPTIATPFASIVCPNAPTIYSVANADPGSNYVWEVPAGGTFEGSNIGASVTIKLTQSGLIKVRREIFAPVACNSAATEQFVAIEQLQIGIGSSITTLPNSMPEVGCSNTTTVYYALKANAPSGLYDDPEAHLTWKIYPESAGSVVAGQNTNTVSVFWNNPLSISGSCQLRLLVSKCNIPQTQFMKPMIIATTPNLSINVSSIQTCSGAPVTFSLISDIPLSPSTVITWSFGPGIANSTSNPGGSVEKIINNNSLVNNDYMVTATINNPNGCGSVAQAVKSFTITPGPVSVISFTGGNVFCDISEINTTLLATTVSGATIQWYRNFVSIPNATSGTLNVSGNSPYGFGIYQFKSSSNQCSSISNPVNIMQQCLDPIPAVCNMPNPNLSITQSSNAIGNCNSIALIAAAAIPPPSSNWSVVGPDLTINSAPGNNGAPNMFLLENLTKAGNYTFFYRTEYGGACNFSKYTSIKIPYLPDFNHTSICSGNSSFALNLINNSNFMAGVQNAQFRYYRASSASGPWTLVGSTPNVSLSGLAAGTYYIKLQIWGAVDGVLQNMCEKITPIVLQTLANHSIVHSTPTCANSIVNFEVTNPTPGDTYLWYFGDGASTTVQNPKRVYAETAYNAIVTIALTITNPNGCSSSLTTSMLIPKPCFAGQNEVTPKNGTVCKGASVTLSYLSGEGDNCPIAKYHWMNSNTEIGVSTTNTFAVSTNGFYWVRLEAVNGCLIDIVKFRTVPHFIEPAKLKLFAPNLICQGDGAQANVATNATTINWFLDGAPQSNTNQTSFDIPELTLGTHQILVEAAAFGCSVSASQSINIVAPPETPQITFGQIDCDTYKVVLNATAAGEGNFNWTNGDSGSSITVNEGGPYGVSFTNIAGCSKYTEIDVPKSPEAYMWVVPSGCYDLCKDNLGTLLGPNIPIKNWEWHDNVRGDEHTLLQGNLFPDPLPVVQDGTYNLLLSNGFCEFKSSDLNVSYIRCTECPLKAVSLIDTQVVIDGFCTYQTVFSAVNESEQPFELAIGASTDDFVFVPSTVTITPGLNTFSLSIIPLNGFNGGISTLNLTSILERETRCSSKVDINLPFCGDLKHNKNFNTIANTDSFSVYPNPATSRVKIDFATASLGSLFVYDLLGHQMAHYQATDRVGSWDLSLDTFAAGVYIVLLKTDDQIVGQKKLIIK